MRRPPTDSDDEFITFMEDAMSVESREQLMAPYEPDPPTRPADLDEELIQEIAFRYPVSGELCEDRPLCVGKRYCPLK